MKRTALVLSLAVICIVLTAVSYRSDDSPAASKITGSWRLVKGKYGKGEMKEYSEKGETAVKVFSGSRWSIAFFNYEKKTYDGAGGGTYKLEGEKYIETIEYFSWDLTSVGQTGVFTMKIENGMLHQYGTFEYNGDKAYVVDEWYQKID